MWGWSLWPNFGLQTAFPAVELPKDKAKQEGPKTYIIFQIRVLIRLVSSLLQRECPISEDKNKNKNIIDMISLKRLISDIGPDNNQGVKILNVNLGETEFHIQGLMSL